MEKETSQEKVTEMLEKAGVPDPLVTLPFMKKVFPKWEDPELEPAAAHKQAGAGKQGHYTNAEAVETQYYTSPALTNTVTAHYMEDYLLFGIKAPAWAIADLEERPPVAERESNITRRS